MTWTGAEPFGGVSHVEETPQGPLHWVDYGGSGPTVVLVHGLGGSHLNWCLAAPLLRDHASVVAPDLVGFGLSHARGRSASLRDNALVLERFLAGRGPVTLVGNSMGGLLTAIVSARSPQLVERVVLVDPALPATLRSRPDPLVLAGFAAYAVPGLGERVLAKRRAQVGPEQLVRDVLALCCAHPERLDPLAVRAAEELVRHRAGEPGLDKSFLQAARSLLRFTGRAPAAWRTFASISAPVLLVHGEKDRLVPVAAARSAARRNPSWRFEELPDVGHVPQLEAPETFAGLVLSHAGVG